MCTIGMKAPLGVGDDVLRSASTRRLIDDLAKVVSPGYGGFIEGKLSQQQLIDAVNKVYANCGGTAGDSDVVNFASPFTLAQVLWNTMFASYFDVDKGGSGPQLEGVFELMWNLVVDWITWNADMLRQQEGRGSHKWTPRDPTFAREQSRMAQELSTIYDRLRGGEYYRGVGCDEKAGGRGRTGLRLIRTSTNPLDKGAPLNPVKDDD